MKTRKFISVLLIMLICAGLVFASGAQSLYSDFETAVQNGDVSGAIEAYNSLNDQIAKEKENIQKDIEKAFDKQDRDLYRNAMNDLRNLSTYSISREDTDALLTAIVNSDSSEAEEWAAWLYENSSYYHPVLTFSTDISSDGYAQSYRRSISVAPGSDVTLPDSSSFSTNTTASGVLTGWGLTPDEVLYEAGETIKMPYTDQTLYAVYKAQVVFNDEYSGSNTVFDDVKAGDVVEVPSAPDQPDAIFEGWYDSTSGQYLSPDESEYTVRGMGASFQALYIKAEATSISTGHYDVSKLPPATQIPLSFAIENTGSEDLRGVDISVSSESEYVTLMNTNAYIRNMKAGKSYNLTGVKAVISSSCPSGTDIPVTVTMTDSEGNTFTSTFNLTSKSTTAALKGTGL